MDINVNFRHEDKMYVEKENLMPKIYRISEVARMFLVDERIILREIKIQQLPCIILGERILRIPQETVELLKQKGITYYRENKRV